MVAHAQLLFNDNSSASTLPTMDPRTSPQFPSQPILFQELASPVVLRLAVPIFLRVRSLNRTLL